MIDFARSVDGSIVTSFAFGVGTRDASGTWNPEQARSFLAYTKRAGGKIVAAEFMNEPNYAAQGGAPKGYDAAAFGRDIARFRPFFREAAPGALLVGPGSTGEGGVLGRTPTPGELKTEDLLHATGPVFDVFSYHIYTAVSQRCAGAMPAIGTSAAVALSSEWLARPDSIHAFYADLRDRYEPGKPLWVTETAQAGCGGDRWASTFLDSFRYLTQQGRLAQKGVQMIAHNTLAASDYALLDEKTFTPRPNYWAALLWRRLMGPTVLNPGPAPEADLYLYAHCMPGRRGGVTVLAINAGASPKELNSPLEGELHANRHQPRQPGGSTNGRELQAGLDGALPRIQGAVARTGGIRLPPVSITFLMFPQARNMSCE